MSKVRNEPPVTALAKAAGIAPEYVDLWGRTHQVEEANLRLLLAALGAEKIQEQPGEPAFNLLPPVVLLEEGGPRTLKLLRPSRSLPRVRLCGEHASIRARDRDSGEFTLTDPLSPGVYDGVVEADLLTETVRDLFTLIVAPKKGYEPPAAARGERLWGVNLPLYALRSERNWGIGDLADLRAAVEFFASLGADAVGLLPLHALPNEYPYGLSPYYPWSRLWLNAVHIAADEVEEASHPEVRAFLESSEASLQLEKLRREELVDYEGVWRFKLTALRLMFNHFDRDSERGEAFFEWAERKHESLLGFATFIVLRDRFAKAFPNGADWRNWPQEYRRPDTEAVEDFMGGNREEIAFHCWLQWLAETQFAQVEALADARSMEVGLYLDLALGVDPGGPDAWLYQDSLALDASAGCPPDPFSLLGQEWGLPPVKPQVQRKTGYRFARRTIQANMVHAGALRIDHAAMLARLFWVPRGKAPKDGAYVTYPMEEQLALLRAASANNRCLVIGEDLGTLPPELYDGLASSGFYSYRLLIFEREENRLFKAPFNFPRRALASFATHDLATMDGWWTGRDIMVKEELGRYPDAESEEEEKAERLEDYKRLVGALVWQNLLPEGYEVSKLDEEELSDLAVATHTYLARVGSALLIANIDDLLGGREMHNLPGTLQEHPNWRRKLTLPLEAWPGCGRLARIVEAIKAERGHSPRGQG